MSDPVLNYAALAKRAEKETGVPAATLLGLISVESGGNPAAVSPTGAFGVTQFEPGTAATYGVHAGDVASQVLGAARYLRDLGYARDPELALAKYNAGPANPAAAGPYPHNVLTAAARYGGAKAPTTGPPTKPTPGAPSTGSSDVLSGFGGQAIDALLTIAVVLAGAVLIGLGTSRATGLRAPHGAIA